MLPIEVFGPACSDKELRAVGVWSSIRHGQLANLAVKHAEVFVLENSAIDGFAACAIAGGDVAALDHEARDHTMKNCAFVVQWLSLLAGAHLSGAESSEVLRCLGHNIIVQSKDNLSLEA